MTMLVASLVELAEKGPGQHVVSKARELLAEIVLPKEVKGEVVGR